MYYPTATMWLGNNEVYKDIVTLTQQLLTHQRDFDYINDCLLYTSTISVTQLDEWHECIQPMVSDQPI